MDFTLPADIEDLRLKVKDFVGGEIMPLEADRSSYDEHENIRIDLCDRVREKARRAGLGECFGGHNSGSDSLCRAAERHSFLSR